MAILRSNGVLIVDAIPTHTPADNEAVLAFNGTSGVFYHFDGSLPWNTIGFALADGDKGDITVSSGGTAWAIDAGAVSYAKIQNVSATSRILGRYSAGAGPIEELQVSTDLEITAGGQLRTTALTGDVTKAAGGAVTTLSNDVVSNAKLANMATDTIKGRDSAGTGDPEDLTLDPTLEFTGTGSIRRAAISGDVVIGAGSNASLIPNDTITYAKMQPVSATDKILGRVSGGAGDVEEITFTDAAQQLADDASFSAMRTTLGLVPGVDVQEHADILDSIFIKPPAGFISKIDSSEVEIRVLLGTANEITVTDGDGVANNPTLSIPTNFDLSTKTTFKIPISANPTMSANGHFALDTSVPDFSHGVPKIYGAEELAVVVVPVAELSGLSNGDILAYNATNDEFEFIPAPAAADATLTALAAYNTNGLLTQTAADTFTGRTITGTANEIAVSNGNGVAGNPTLSLPAVIDLGGKTSLEIPNSAAPTVDADGKIAVDTSVTDFSHGILKYFGGEEMGVIAVPIGEFTGLMDGDVLRYNAAADEFQIGAVPTASGGTKVYKAYWAQSGTSAPTLVATVVNDFGGTFTLARTGAGVYTATLVGAFPDLDKFFPLTVIAQSTGKPIMHSVRRTSADAITLEIYTHDGTAIDLDGRIAIGFEQYA